MKQLLFFAQAHERFLAHLIDSLIVSVGAYAIATLMQANEDGLQMAITFITGLFYYAYFQSGNWQASPGMRVLSIRLIRLGSQAKISARDAVMRYLAFMGPTLPIYVSFLDDQQKVTLVVWLGMVWYVMVLIRLDRAAMHDLVCGQRVVRGRTGG